MTRRTTARANISWFNSFNVDYTCDLPKISHSVNIDHHRSNYENLVNSNRLTEGDVVLPEVASATDLVFDYLTFSDDPVAEEIRELGHLADTALLPAEYKPLDIVLNMNVDNPSFLRTLSEKLAIHGKNIIKTQWLKDLHEKVVSIHQETQEVIIRFLEGHPMLPRVVLIDWGNS